MKKVVVNGCFDMLHYGHVKLLEFAAREIDSFVYVLIDSDLRIKQLKGNDRPINNEVERKFLLESLRFVDRVEIFNSDTELENKIKLYQPDVMIKGSDYKNKPIIGQEYCKEIVFYDRIEPYSTTEKIKNIINWRNLY
jgi:rfaE bifunctional protein nucleotidyltransferase chain/domain